jgi:polyisoprenoid-binding protein YceI
LQSDESRRDNAIRGRGLESEQFPTAVFELAEPIRLDRAPVSGQEVNGQGKGRLTVHGVTHEVTADLQGRWDGSTIQVAGRMPVRMTDFQIQPPTFGPVLSIEDSLTVEFRLTSCPPERRALRAVSRPRLPAARSRTPGSRPPPPARRASARSAR